MDMPENKQVTFFVIGGGSVTLTTSQNQLDQFLGAVRDNREGIISTPVGGLVVRHVTHWKVD